MNKEQAKTLIKHTFEASFDKEKFTKFIIQFLNLKIARIENKHPYSGNLIPDAYEQSISTLERIAKYSDGENEIDILIVKLKKETSLEKARTMQRNFIAWYLNGSRGGKMKDAALAAFVSPDKEDWRFSLVKMDYKFERTKTGKIKVKEEFTPARRWSFLVGANEKSHTAQSQLVNILRDDEHDPTLEEIEKAFDIETVTKEFFLKYRELFLRTKEELDRVVKNDPKIKDDFESKDVDTVNFAKKLLGQIIFLYFLQKKGWFGVGRDDDWGTGSKHFLRELFEKNHGDYKNFFNDILEPLFYEALRRDRSDDDGYYSRFNCKIPFLNGGLFDPIGSDRGYNWVDTDILLPDKLFSNTNKAKEGDIGTGILDIFDRYNFTVKEDEPLEKEVAIDPELLGKSYEKFNAIRPDNYDEFKKALKSGKRGEENKFNKKFGVYYTPREIVHYMCQQSLINYLATEFTDCHSRFTSRHSRESGNPVVSKKDIETLIHTGEQVSENEARVLRKGKETETYSHKLPESIRKNAKLIDEKLADITVCDPAVGSGAFPVGMMAEIVKTRNVLTTYIKKSNTDIPVCEKSNTDIPVCEKSNTDIPVCAEDIHKTRRNLPHWTKEGAIYWVTFRLADSLPSAKLSIWKAERDIWIKKHPEPWSDREWREYSERFGEQLEKWLDFGYGSCLLGRPEVQQIVKECLLRFNEERLRLHSAVIMPNHVHILLEPLREHSLSELLKGIKGASARQINKILGTTGREIWMEESYDHIVRSETQYFHFIRYIANNPAKANLPKDKYWLYHSSTGILTFEESQTGMSVVRSTYNFKRECIENSLYGVDIDPGAVEIAKLRLWLSLVVDEEDIKNIKPLPNLDYKIVCGNSLLGVEKDLFNAQLFSEMERLKPLFFNETNPTKKQEYKKQIEELISEITSGHTEFDFEVYFSEVFHEKGGFDVVIANPPYVKEYVNRKAFDGIRNSPYYMGKMDIWYIFACNGIDLLENKGVLAFIAQNNWVTSYGAKKMRNKVLSNTNILQLLDFGDYKIFENADIQTMIMLFQKTQNSSSYKFDFRRLHFSNKVNFRDVLDLLSKSKNEHVEYLSPDINSNNLIDKSIVFSNKVFEKILNKLKEKNNFILDGHKEVAQGIVYPQDFLNKKNKEILGNDFKVGEGIFVLSNEEKNSIPFTENELRLIKPEYTTKELFKYNANPKSKYWVIYTDSSFKNPNKIKKYPNIKKHLDRFRKVITSDNKPYGLHRARDEKFFIGEKIISVRKCVEPTFTYTDFHCYVSATFYVIKSQRINKKFLTALLNSKLIAFWLRHKGKMQGNNYQIDKEPLLSIPIVKPEKHQQMPIINLIGKILAKKKCAKDADDEEKEIDQLVYKLYDLTEEEIDIVEAQGGKKNE